MAQFIIAHLVQNSRQPVRLHRLKPLFKHCWPLPQPQHRLLHDLDARNRLKAEIDVQPGENFINFVLEKHRPCAFTSYHQLPWLKRVFVSGPPWPYDFFRSCVLGVQWPDQISPRCQKVNPHPGAAGNHRFKYLRRKFRHRPCNAHAFLAPIVRFGAHRLQSVSAALDFKLTILSLVAMKNPEPIPTASTLLGWYDRHARNMPWRVAPALRKTGVKPDPYHVWLSEVMLQQTQVSTVVAYFLDFLQKWPTIKDLALAPDDDVMKAWAGLGYYSRARNLKKCAETVWHEFGGHFPQTANGLAALPGIGPYTAAAMASIAFDEPVAVVDGNVERVFSRLFLIEEPMPQGKETVRRLVSQMLSRDRPGDFAQATMDLGATLCSPRKPACPLCPLAQSCLAAQEGIAQEFPRKLAKSKKPARVGAAFVIMNSKAEVFLQRRDARGLLGGMTAVPTTNWSVRADGATGAASAPVKGNWLARGKISHSFTHFDLELEVWALEGIEAIPLPGWWAGDETLSGEALPTVMKKVIDCAIGTSFTRINPAKGRKS